MATKSIVAKAWSITPSSDGKRWSAWPAGDKPAGGGAGPMSSTFSVDESPLAQDAIWAGGLNTGLIFQDMMASGGVAHGTNASPSSYDDSISSLTGHAADHFVEVVLYRAAGYSPAVPHEIQLHVRTTITANNYTTYEWLMDSAGNFQALRLNGPIGSFVPLSPTNLNGGPAGVVNGHTWRLRVVGSVFTVSQNGVDVSTWTDATYATGNPAIATFWRPDASIVRGSLGFTSIVTGNL